jgi:type II secretory pathway component PulF
LPIIELAAALVIIGVVILAQGIVGQMTNTKIDLLGFGLTGTSGLVVYLLALAVIGLFVALFLRALARGALWTRPIQRLALALPGIGKPLKTICLARVAWAMHLTFKTGMDVRRALRLSLQSANNAYFSDHIRAVEGAITGGDSVADAFEQTHVFPADFLNTLRVAEDSGRVAESMAHLSRQYAQQAEVAMTVLATMGGFAVYGLVALFLIAMIFRIAASSLFPYYSTIRSLSGPPQ